VRNDYSSLLLRRRDFQERRRLVVASSSKSTSESMMGKVTLLSFLLANEFVAPAMTLIALLLNVVAANATARGGNGGDIISFAALLASKLALSALLLKIVAGFLLPVDVASCAAYWTFPWRPRSEFEDKKVLITGASQGLGEAIAYHVSSFGAKVILASRNVKNLEEVGKKCLENGASAVEIVSFDALKPKSAEALAKAASKAFSSNNDDDNNTSSCCCDYAFLCAGASQSASAFDVTESAERELFNLNALSTIQVLKNILPSMIAQNRGRVCVISSMAAICPAPGQSSYAASKAALSKYVDSLRAEIGRTAKNVTLTNCFPGPIATGFNGKKRVVFNATGVNENHPKGVAKGRLPVELVAKMAVKLTAFGAYSVHLAPKLVMFLSRCVHFCPTLAYAVMDKLGPKRARAAKKGESLYELKVKDN
jgi:dehydrogenase/reductase SDR family protein 7